MTTLFSYILCFLATCISFYDTKFAFFLLFLSVFLYMCLNDRRGASKNTIGYSNTIKVSLMSSLAKSPKRSSPGSAGYDLTSCEEVKLNPGMRYPVSTGIKLEINVRDKNNEMIYGRIAPRSGLAVKNGIDVLAGVIDSDYRGEIKVVLINHGTETYIINPGDRIAQLIFEKIEICVDYEDNPSNTSFVNTIPVTSSLSETTRGEGGFGSTGKN